MLAISPSKIIKIEFLMIFKNLLSLDKSKKIKASRMEKK